ncbi:hypothetical protein [Corynebacterium bovis]
MWRRFFARTGGRIPAAPVELLDPVPVDGPSSATAASALPAPAHRVIDLVPADRMTGDLGERTFAVALTELARALEPETGRSELPVVIPVHTRGGRRSPLHDLVGWFVTNAPVIADARDVDATRAWLRDAVAVADARDGERAADPRRPPRGTECGEMIDLIERQRALRTVRRSVPLHVQPRERPREVGQVQKGHVHVVPLPSSRCRVTPGAAAGPPRPSGHHRLPPLPRTHPPARRRGPSYPVTDPGTVVPFPREPGPPRVPGAAQNWHSTTENPKAV